MIACAFVMTASLGTVASAHTQCAPYAREISGIDLHGAAGGWWGQAEGLYARGHDPKIGSVLAFRATHAMPSGHVAVVKSVVLVGVKSTLIVCVPAESTVPDPGV